MTRCASRSRMSTRSGTAVWPHVFRPHAGAPGLCVSSRSAVVNDVPLLVESGIAGTFDLVVVVLASEATRLHRLVDGRGMSEQEARGRIAAQATDEQRRAVADIVIENDGTVDELIASVDRVWHERLATSAAG